MTTKHNPTPWGVTVLDKDTGTGQPAREGAMIVSPPPLEALRRIKERQPVTSARVAMLNASHYTPHDVAVANAEFIVRAVNCHDGLLAALKRLVACTEILPSDSSEKIAADNAAIAAIARAEAP